MNVSTRRSEDVALYVVVAGVLLSLVVFFWRAHDSLETVTVGPLQGEATTVRVEPVPSFESLQLSVADLRYRQAALALYTQSARRSGGLLVGALLAMIGGLFVIRRINIGGAAVDVEAGGGFKATLISSSPGMILALFGTTIIIAALVVRDSIDVKDDLRAAVPVTASSLQAGGWIAPTPEELADAEAATDRAIGALREER